MLTLSKYIVQKEVHHEKEMTLLAYSFFGLLVTAVVLFMSFAAKQVSVGSGNKQTSFFTFAPTVGQVIKEAGFKSGIGLPRNPSKMADGETISFQTLSEELDTGVINGMSINVYQNRISRVVEKQEIIAPVRREWDVFLEPGIQRVIKPGRTGLITNTMLIYYRDGAIIDKKKINSNMVTSPGYRVIAYGSHQIASRQGINSARKPEKFIATAYTYTGHRTATGARTRRGIVAVDPRVIPLGSRLYIPGYGYAIAADTGGAIKGKIVDVFLESTEAAQKWGRRHVNIYILRKE